MNATPSRPPKHSRSTVVLVLLLGLGLLMMFGRMLVQPGVGLGDLVLPLLVGTVMAVGIILIIRRDRRERARLPPSQRDRMDQGTPL